ncbi:hypothetical protein [Citrobacter portucalensis]|uniref:hypothetical protein n=1 Tax=Citrobacter portucalensis TaxID=1639133 RepID=UPI002243B943|nr:hypothetical protein [Citrobacter portucalensis]MCW8351463.1 hypothetical protein [Citrobacter portucalensis]MCX9050839.1 hypothetical protein [Citrobacter portucalensis]MCX9056859.1 hypothetical protein [Citrobacter portucalensis]
MSYEEYAEFEANKNNPAKAKQMLDQQFVQRPEKPAEPTVYTNASGKKFIIVDGVTQYLE